MNNNISWFNLGIIVLFLSILPTTIFNGGDFERHFEKSKNGCEEIENWNNCEGYHSLYHKIAFFFSFNEKIFYYFNLFLFAFLTPLLLIFLAKNQMAGFFYFTTTNYFFYFMDGIFSQGMTMLLGLGMLLTDDKRIQLIILALMSLAHGHGFFLGLIFFIAKNIPFKEIEEIPYKIFKKNNNFLLCSGLFGTNKINILKNEINISAGGYPWKIENIIHPFTKIFPFPFIFLALKSFFEKKQYCYTLLIFSSIIGGFIISNRVFYVFSLIGIIGLTQYYEETTNNQKKLILFSSIFIGFIQWFSFFNFKKCIEMITGVLI